MGEPVLADAQFSVAKILVPCVGWEAYYSGHDSYFRPMFLTEDGVRYDASAGKPGYASRLIKGLSVPVGSRILLWLPRFPVMFGTTAGERNYTFHIGWRLRNLFDFRTTRIPYHFPRQKEGVPDTGTLDPGPRVVIPGAGHSIVDTQTPQAFPLHVENNVIGDGIKVGYPALSMGVAVDPQYLDTIQQGFFNSATYTAWCNPSFMTYDLRAMGDEMVISVKRTYIIGGQNNKWDWDDYDKGLFTFFSGSPMAGVYVMIGSAP